MILPLLSSHRQEQNQQERTFFALSTSNTTNVHMLEAKRKANRLLSHLEAVVYCGDYVFFLSPPSILPQKRGDEKIVKEKK